MNQRKNPVPAPERIATAPKPQSETQAAPMPFGELLASQKGRGGAHWADELGARGLMQSE
jgi:hypothetical protein